MSGLNNIIKEIQASAKEEADAILKEADDFCNAQMEEAKIEIEKEIKGFEKKSLASRKLYKEKTKSSAGFRERNAILNNKQKCINDVIESAICKIENLDTTEYFDFLEKLFNKNVQSDTGVMYISTRDKTRMPGDFVKKIEKRAKEKNGSITIEDSRDNVENGFVLVYGDIEENCQIKALFNGQLDRLKDIANRELFG